MPQHNNGGQRTALGSWFFPSTLLRQGLLFLQLHCERQASWPTNFQGTVSAFYLPIGVLTLQMHATNPAFYVDFREAGLGYQANELALLPSESSSPVLNFLILVY